MFLNGYAIRRTDFKILEGGNMKCDVCKCDTDLSYYREDENETVCEDCYIEWQGELLNKGFGL